MRLHQFNGTTDGPLNGRFAHIQRIRGTRQLQQRIHQIGQPVHGNADLQIKLFALLRRQIGIGQKFRIGQDRGQRMTQVMRNRTGHSSDGRQSFGIEQSLLRAMQALAHG